MQAGKGGDDARSDAEWDLALSDYRAATQSFQRSRNLSGAIFAASNAALVIAQQGRDAQAIKVSVCRCAAVSITASVAFWF